MYPRQLHSDSSNAEANSFTALNQMMANQTTLRPLTSDPKVLIEMKDNKLIPVSATIDWIKNQHKAVSIISIIGPTGLGKSYLMNYFMKNDNKLEGFPSKNNIDGTTRGIWIWGLEHPARPNEIVLLLDTEGQLDIERSQTHDTKIALLTLLLSSVIIFNVGRKIGSDLIQQLGSLAYYAQQIHFDSELGIGRQGHISEHLPALIVLIRDFQSRLQFEGLHVTPDSYLENCLRENTRTADWDKNIDPMRRLINEMFPREKRFGRILPCPFTSFGDGLMLPEGVPTFETGAEELKQLTLCLSQPKTLSNNAVMNGRYFGELIITYVNLLNRGDAINIHPTHVLIAKEEKEKLIQEAKTIYENLMKNLNYPMDNKMLNIQHSKISSILIQDILPKVVFDDVSSFTSDFQTSLLNFFEMLVSKNDEESIKKCKRHLIELHKDIDKKIKDGEFFCPNGFELYKADMDMLKKQYENIPNKGPKAESSLLQFLSKREGERTLILKADNHMTELKIREEEIRIKEEENKMRAEQAEKERLEQDQQIQNLMRQNEEMKRQFEEEQRIRIQQYEEQLETQRRQMEEYRNNLQRHRNNPWNQILEVATAILSALPVGQMLRRRL